MAFWFGGGLIHAIRGTNRGIAEVEGLTIAVISFSVAMAAKIGQDRLDEGAEGTSKSLGEGLRK
jgi:hypothetical protein